MPRFHFTSRDGTGMVGWRNNGAGLPVVISNGLGTPPEAWPELIRPDSGFAVRTWYYRGVGGSGRPATPTRIRVQDHVDDLLALMDHERLDCALLACWSLGVNVGFEFARAHPDRVAGLLAVAGVPGGTFRSMMGPLPIPRQLRHPLGVAGAELLSTAGPLLSVLLRHLPLNRFTATLINHSGFMTPAAQPEVLIPALREFRGHDFRWYFGLAVAAATHEPMDVSFVRVPVTFLAGRYDLLTSMQDMVDTAALIPHAQVKVLPGSHFLPLEYPKLVAESLWQLAQRTELAATPGRRRRAARARADASTTSPPSSPDASRRRRTARAG